MRSAFNNLVETRTENKRTRLSPKSAAIPHLSTTTASSTGACSSTDKAPAPASTGTFQTCPPSLPPPAQSPTTASITSNQTRAQLLLPFLGSVVEDKPRPFANAIGVWGDGSCYLNAALQLLFSSPRVQLTLSRLISTWRDPSTFSQRLWRFCTLAGLPEIKASRRRATRTWDDNTLAFTFAAAMQARTPDGRSIRGRHLFPALFLKEFYDGRQEDASDFLLQCLRQCPLTQKHCEGEFSQASFRCATCGTTAMSHAPEIERKFSTLQIQLQDPDTGRLCSSLEQALHHLGTDRLDDEFQETCTNASCARRWSHKLRTVEVMPDTLILLLNSWENVGTSRNPMLRRIPCLLPIPNTLTFQDSTFLLYGVIYQTGDTPRSGHYVAVTRHGHRAESFLVYNDELRQSVPRATLSCSMSLPGSGKDEIFHATTFLYERQL